MNPSITTQLEAIRAAFADGASPEDIRAGAIACRTLAAVLDAQPGQPLGPVAATPSPIPLQLTAVLPQLGQLNVDQILDLVIAKLTDRLPPGTSLPAPRAYPLPALTLGGGK